MFRDFDNLPIDPFALHRREAPTEGTETASSNSLVERSAALRRGSWDAREVARSIRAASRQVAELNEDRTRRIESRLRRL